MSPEMVEAKIQLQEQLRVLRFRNHSEDMSQSLSSPKPKRQKRLGSDNVIGMGLGEKKTRGSMTGETVIRVYVREKTAFDNIDENARVPDTTHGGFKTDVIEALDMVAQSHTGFEDFPIPCGSSIGSSRGPTGTIGALVEMDDADRSLAMLSNNHVLAASNEGAVNDDIYQPGPDDGGGRYAEDRVAILLKYIQLRFDGSVNLVDAAVALTSTQLVSPRHHNFSINPDIVEDPMTVSQVRKDGRTTGVTTGTIIGHSEDGFVSYKGGLERALFTDQIRIIGSGEPFSQRGDSGSLIVDSTTFRPVALLFAGNGVTTTATPIATVMRELGIRQFVGEGN
jgi:hypothetical protein